MNDGRAALAVFVKTPGLSPIKTRLAAGIGPTGAQEFYRLSLAAIERTVTSAADASPFVAYWAVAEETGLADPRWQRFARVGQGNGGLDQRLCHVFEHLKRGHDLVVAIGADSPQITAEIVGKAFDTLRPDRPLSVLGRCHDGGFYLVGANRNLTPSVWEGVPYGGPEAANRLAENLARHGTVCELMWLSDVDRAEDLPVLRDELEAVPVLSSQQRAILAWITATLNL